MQKGKMERPKRPLKRKTRPNRGMDSDLREQTMHRKKREGNRLKKHILDVKINEEMTADLKITDILAKADNALAKSGPALKNAKKTLAAMQKLIAKTS